jgi:hypothetical protein
MRTALAVLVAVVSCADSHGRIPGLDPNRRLIDMTEAEWQLFCDWRQELRAPEPLEYHCAYPGREPIDFCDRPGTTPCRYWDASGCLRGTWSLPQLFPNSRTDCTATVEEYAACWQARAELVCYYNVAGDSEECDLYRSRCPGG